MNKQKRPISCVLRHIDVRNVGGSSFQVKGGEPINHKTNEMDTSFADSYNTAVNKNVTSIPDVDVTVTIKR